MKLQIKDGRLIEPKIHVKNLKPGLKTDVMVAKAINEIVVVKRGVCYVKHPKYANRKSSEIIGSTLHKFQPSTNGDHALNLFMWFCHFGDAEMMTSECGTTRIVVNEGFEPYRNLAVIQQDTMFHHCNYHMMICYAAINAAKELDRIQKTDWRALPAEARKARTKERREFFKRVKARAKENTSGK